MSIARPRVSRDPDSPFFLADHAFEHLYVEFEGKPVLGHIIAAIAGERGAVYYNPPYSVRPVISPALLQGDVRIYSHKPRWLK